MYLEKFFGVFTSVGESAESFISFECLMKDSGLSDKIDYFYLKTLLIAMVPIIAVIVYMICFGLINFIRKVQDSPFKK